MIKQAKRYFNTSGPNIPEKHYTLDRKELIKKGATLVEDDRYFTIWAPRQTGKTTYFRMLAEELEKKGCRVLQTNLENFGNSSESELLTFLCNEFSRKLDISLQAERFSVFLDRLLELRTGKIVLIIDEIEGLNREIFGQFLHTIRSLYHSRESHSLKSIILVGVSNIIGVVQDNASPFNIADNLDVPYFTSEETFELLSMHELETGQLFDPQVKEKVSYITGNQPGLVNGVAYQLVERNRDAGTIDIEHYLEVESWYINKAIDKNISNIISKARKYRKFVETLLFNETPVKFRINDEKIKFLSSYGVIKDDENGNVTFNVPLYKKALLDAFYPYSNGERDRFFHNVSVESLFSKGRGLDFDVIVDNYREYVKRWSFRYFRDRDPETGEYSNIKEAALAYSFETYIQALVQLLEGKSYLEPHTGLGRSDLVINVQGKEYVVEFKIFRDTLQFNRGKKQLAYYCKSLGIDAGIYLVFVPNTVTLPGVEDAIEDFDGIQVKTYIVPYDEEKDF